MEIYVKDIMQLMEDWAPSSLAESWDHPGLQVGNPNQPVHKILVALDMTELNISYAIDHGVDMVISHHPFLFKPIHDIDLSTCKGRMIENLIRHRITSFAAHTNLDSAVQGVNDALAEKLGLQECKGFVPVMTYSSYKFTLYITAAHAKLLKKKLDSLRGKDIESYYVVDDADDFTENIRVEFRVPGQLVKRVEDMISSLDKSAKYDVYKLVNHGYKETMGRIGRLPFPMSVEKALSYIKNKLEVPVLRYAGNKDCLVEKIAILGGAGAEFAGVAKSIGADLYLTGDLKYHEAQDAAMNGLVIADGGHFYTERVIIPYLAKRLRDEFKTRGWNVGVLEDVRAKDIFHCV